MTFTDPSLTYNIVGKVADTANTKLIGDLMTIIAAPLSWSYDEDDPCRPDEMCGVCRQAGFCFGERIREAKALIAADLPRDFECIDRARP